jgi:ferredoxin
MQRAAQPEGAGFVVSVSAHFRNRVSTQRDKLQRAPASGELGLANCLTRCHIPRKTENQFMADVANKYPENISGKFYVDNQCIDCDLCRETAPDNFKRNEDGGYSFVSKQPATPDEEARCKEAKEGCPVEAIGDNGA